MRGGEENGKGKVAGFNIERPIFQRPTSNEQILNRRAQRKAEEGVPVTLRSIYVTDRVTDEFANPFGKSQMSHMSQIFRKGVGGRKTPVSFVVSVTFC